MVNTCSISEAKLRKVGVSCFQDVLQNLYNVHTKIECKEKSFKSELELPAFTITTISDICEKIKERLSYIFTSEKDEFHQVFLELGKDLLHAKSNHVVLDRLNNIYKQAWTLLKQWEADDALYVGVVPKPNDDTFFTIETDKVAKKSYIHWEHDTLGEDFLGAVSRMLRMVREKRRQPTPQEYVATHLAYLEIAQGKWGRHEQTRGLGTPGFRPHTQTYMSLTDPGEGHVLGTTRFTEWMDGAIVHVEHLERPRNLPRENIESYRVPSVLDFSRVRLHVGSTAPTTYFLGRAVKDSGNFDEDFLKIVHITAAAASSAFFMGAAEVKISMEGLSTSQAVRYMQGLRAQVQRKRKQLLSAAWNLNQIIVDDCLENDDNEKILSERFDIAMAAVRITSYAGFDKVTWDGASDTYPSKCIMYQLSFEEALTIVHEAHLKGLVTYFSAGFKFNEIQHAVYAGVDGIGIGGAQVLRYMDGESGMHGPYTEENIPEILRRRDEAAYSTRGKGVTCLVKLDTMYFEGSISRPLEYLRQKLFKALLQKNEDEIESLLDQLTNVTEMPREGNMPYLHRAKRIAEAENPMLKEFCSEEEWENFTGILRSQIAARDENSLVEEYDSDPWLSIRHRYRQNQCPRDSKICYVRQTSFQVPYKC